jgi:hypothetical protein
MSTDTVVLPGVRASMEHILDAGYRPAAGDVTQLIQGHLEQLKQEALAQGSQFSGHLRIDHELAKNDAIFYATLTAEAREGCLLALEKLSAHSLLFARIGFPGRHVVKPRRWFHKVLLKDQRCLADYSSHVLKSIGSGGSKIVSPTVLRSRRRQRASQIEFIEAAEIVTVRDDLTLLKIPFKDVCNTPLRRYSKVYVRLKGLEKFCTSIGLCGYFVTFTLPARYHPNPKFGTCTWSGASPAEGHEELQHCWRTFQRRFGKIFGVRVQEQHEDGCVHCHSLMWLSPERDADFRKKLEKYFGSSPATKIEMIDVTKASGATYLTKYLQKSFGNPDLANEDQRPAELADAHRATWGGRAIQFFDVKTSGTVWDEIRRLKSQTSLLKHLSPLARELHEAAVASDYSSFLEILLQLRLQKRIKIWYDRRDSGTKFLRGLVIDNQPLETHSVEWKLELKGVGK